MFKGKVIRLISEKGFGFISHDSKDYFFHRDDFLGHWNDLVEDFHAKRIDIEVQFLPTETTKGFRAQNVSRMDFPNQIG